MRLAFKKTILLFALIILPLGFLYAQLPSGKILIGYHENWKQLRLTDAHNNYNVVCLAFAVDRNNYPGYDLSYDLPTAYSSDTDMENDINLLHAQGKVVLLSIGGYTGPVQLTSVAQKNTFISSVNAILNRFGNKIDGIDLDLEGPSMAFSSTWTMSSPDQGQLYLVDAIKSIMSTYQATNNKKMLLTAAPEAYYLTGGLSSWQVQNNGGTFLPILDGLRNEIDLLNIQLYNDYGGQYAWDNNIYYNGTPDFALAICESVIKGFTLQAGKGSWAPFPDSKMTFGLPCSNAAAGTGYLAPADICDAFKYFIDTTNQHSGYSYTMYAPRPALRGLMTWSIDEDNINADGQWNFATGFDCIKVLPTPIPTAVKTADVSNTTLCIKENPFVDVVHLLFLTMNQSQSSAATIEVIDISGKVLMTKNIQANDEIAIGEDLKAGVYVLVFQYKEETKRFKIVKQ